jgi:hypothetical protein
VPGSVCLGRLLGFCVHREFKEDVRVTCCALCMDGV